MYREFATPPETDGFWGEVQNLLSQLFGLMTRNPKFTDNASVSLAAVDAAAARSGGSGSNGRLVLAMSETPAANYLINPDDLSTVEQVRCAARPHIHPVCWLRQEGIAAGDPGSGKPGCCCVPASSPTPRLLLLPVWLYCCRCSTAMVCLVTFPQHTPAFCLMDPCSTSRAHCLTEASTYTGRTRTHSNAQR